jgi:hypothetical protein
LYGRYSDYGQSRQIHPRCKNRSFASLISSEVCKDRTIAPAGGSGLYPARATTAHDCSTKPDLLPTEVDHTFQLGNTKPEIDLTPSFQATIRANTTKGSNLFDKDPFRVASTVPDQTGYVSLALQGSLDLGVSGSSGDLTFGVDANRTIGLEYWKAFPLGNGGPSLGEATGATVSGFVIPADVDDLKLLALNDICTVSGHGSLKISGGFKVSLSEPAGFGRSPAEFWKT